MEKVFAYQYPRDDKGLIRFPVDRPWRVEHMVPEALKHPARANVYMVQEIYRYVAEPGETLLDITAGTGTLMIAELEGYQVILIELEEPFYNIIHQNALKISVSPVVLLGDCREYLPLPCDHIIFSPPYASAIHDPGKGKIVDILAETGKHGTSAEGIASYISHPKNLSRLNAFMFGQEMEKIYRKCLDSVRPGGSMTIIIQDYIKGGERQLLGDLAMRQCIRTGWEFAGWERRWQPGTFFKAMQKSKGFRVVEEEDILFFRKEK